MSETHDTGGRDYLDGEHPEFSTEALDLIEQAWEALESDEPDRALQLMQDARDLEPDNDAIDVELADMLYDLGRLDEVITLCRTVMEVAPETPRGRRLLALALHERGDQTEALALFEEERRKTPDDPHLLVSLADVLGAMQRPRQAMEIYRRALELERGLWGAHHGLGLCLVQLENYKAAMDHFRAALQFDENQPEVWWAWGDLLITLRDWRGAREKLRRAVAIDEEYAEAWERLSLVCEHLGDSEEAVLSLRRAIFWNPEVEDLLDHLATAYHPHLRFARSWEITLSGQYRFSDAVPPDRPRSERFRRTYQVWAPDQETALEFIGEIESAMWEFEFTVEEIVPGEIERECHGGVVYIGERLYESTLTG